MNLNFNIFIYRSTNNVISTPIVPPAKPTGSHFMESVAKANDAILRHDTFCWACHLDGPVIKMLFHIFFFLSNFVKPCSRRLWNAAIVHEFSTNAV